MYIIRVDGRVFEKSKTKERKDEMVEILKNLYPGKEITVERTADRRKWK